MESIMTAKGATWRPIPNGVRVRCNDRGEEGLIDGLTEIVEGRLRNPDGSTQYRIDTGEATRRLAAEEELSIVVDQEGLVIIPREAVGYRRFVTECLHGTLSTERFVAQSHTDQQTRTGVKRRAPREKDESAV